MNKSILIFSIIVTFFSINAQTSKSKLPPPSDISTIQTPNQKTASIIKSQWNEANLKERFQSSANGLEGIYEFLRFTPEERFQPKLKIGIILESDLNYNIIYLSGLEEHKIWESGSILGHINKTSANNFYTVNWIMTDRLLDEDVYCKLDENNLLNFIFSDHSIKKYLKLFPLNNQINNSSDIIKGTATAFAISPDGYLVTCEHVINGSRIISIKGIGGDYTKSYKAKIILEDKNNDLAILKIDDYSFPGLGDIPYIPKESVVDVGTSVFALGYPLLNTMGNEIKLTDGIISSKTGYQGDVTAYQFSAPVQPGNSGGPLFNKNGNLIGVISAKHTNAENVSYAVKIKYLTSLIDALPNYNYVPPKNSLMKLSLTDQLKIIKNFIFIIEIK